MTYKVNKLYVLAEKYHTQDITEEEIVQIDMTKTLHEEFEKAINTGERLFVEIHGTTRSAKSTIAIAIAQDLYKYMEQSPRYTIKEPFGIKNIARDQSERVKKLMNPNTNHTVIITDEDNELEKTGANSSSNEALQKTISDIHAGRYVHEIMISPRDFLDPNTQIILNTVPGGINKKDKTVLCKLYFRFWEGVLDQTQLLGHVKVNVGTLIKTWTEKAQELFFMPRPNIEHYKNGHEDRMYIEDCKTYAKRTAQIEELCKKDFYTQYQVKKYEKMDMLTKEGVFRPRMLEVAMVILKVYEELKILADSKVLNKPMVKNFIKMRMREAKIVNSILGEDLATEEAFAILNTLKSVKAVEKEMKKNPQLESVYRSKIEVLGQALNLQIEELRTYKRINEAYNE